jgi:AraC-like DNA-binding protein
MNLQKIILIIGFYQTIILAGIMLLKKHKSRSDNFLAALFFVYGLTLFLGFMEIYNRENNYPFPFFINSSSPFILLHGPALWFYIKSLTFQNFRFKAKYLLHFLPFLSVLLLLIMSLYKFPAHERIMIDSSESFKKDISFPLLISMIAFSTQGYFIWGLWLIKQYKQKIRNYFSELSSLDLAWLRVLIVSGIIFYAGVSLLYMLDYLFSLFSYHVLQSIGYSYVSLFILVIGYKGYRQGNVFSSHPVTIDLDADIRVKEPSETSDSKDKDFVDHLLSLMESEKPHLNPELTLSLLADQLKTNPDYLSSILNGHLKKNFFDFVNHYRVEEFKMISKSQKNHNITIMGMAWDAGFNSKATFNRVFKKNTGITPGEFIIKQNNKS